MIKIGKPDRTRLVLYGIIVIGCVIRLINAWMHNPIDNLWSDPLRHWEYGNHAADTGPMGFIDPIGYQLWLSMVVRFTTGIPILTGLYAGLLSIFTPWCYYRFLREMLDSKTYALAGWAILSLLPSWIGIYSYFMSETLLLPLIGLSLYFTWRCKRKQTLESFLTMVLLWTAAGLTRGIAIPMAAVAGTWLWLSQSGKLRKAVYSIIILVLILGPLAVRSYRHLGVISPHGFGKLVKLYAVSGSKQIMLFITTDQGTFNYSYQSPSVTEPTARALAPLSSWTSFREGTVTVVINTKNGATDWDKAIKKYHLSLKDRLRYIGDGLILLFFSPTWPDCSKDSTFEQMSTMLRFIWAPLLITILFFSFKKIRWLGHDGMLLGMLLIWFMLQGLTLLCVNEGRYMKPAEGLIIAQGLLIIDRVRKNKMGDSE